MASKSVLPNPLHLFRAILRETTYLPDPAARDFFRRYAVSSFQTWVPNKHRKYKPIGVYRQVKLQARARNRLSLLRRANEGYLKSLELVLKWTYGRSGPRRYGLLRPILENHIPEISTSDEPVEQFSENWIPGPMFGALLKAQSDQRKRMDRAYRGKTKLTERASIPTKNSWGLPMPKVRQPNLLRKWFGANAFLLFPPLPPDERERLRKLILEPTSEADILRDRRTRVGDWSQQDPELFSEESLVNGPRKDVTLADFAQGRPHRLTPRTMTLLWAKIYEHTPEITWNQKRASYVANFHVIDPRAAKARASHMAIVSDEQMSMLFQD